MRVMMPLDPECPVASKYIEAVCNDPMTRYSGCEGEIIEQYTYRHRQQCKRCMEYGLANADVE
jgi:hypothetical protein